MLDVNVRLVHNNVRLVHGRCECRYVAGRHS